jgi:RimJ/RimL family protein N-acetyltransferase
MSAELEFLDRPGAFLDAAGELLAAEPVEATVMVTVSDRMRRELADGLPLPDDFPVWWVVERDEAGCVVGAGMRTAPFGVHPVYLMRMGEDAARRLARVLHHGGESVGGVNGSLSAVEAFAAETARLTGGTVRVSEHTRLWVLGDLEEPTLPPGRLRPAEERDVDQVAAWYDAFGRDAAEQAGRSGPHAGPEEDRDSMLRRIADGTVFVWEDASGVPVHVTGASRPMFGVSRIGPVYTPPDQRGRGYAGATVAAVARTLLDEGARVCLFTDRANPVSNALYERLGFRPVADQANLLIDP